MEKKEKKAMIDDLEAIEKYTMPHGVVIIHQENDYTYWLDGKEISNEEYEKFCQYNHVITICPPESWMGQERGWTPPFRTWDEIQKDGRA